MKQYETVRPKGTFKTSDITKQIYILQYIQWKHLKHYYGSITVRENILCVYVCVTNTTKNYKKGLNDKVSYACWLCISKCSFLSAVLRNCCFRGWKKSHRQGIQRKGKFVWPIHFVAFDICWWIRESESIFSGSHTGESALALQAKMWKRGRAFENEVFIENMCLGIGSKKCGTKFKWGHSFKHWSRGSPGQ